MAKVVLVQPVFALDFWVKFQIKDVILGACALFWLNLQKAMDLRIDELLRWITR